MNQQKLRIRAHGICWVRQGNQSCSPEPRSLPNRAATATAALRSGPETTTPLSLNSQNRYFHRLIEISKTTVS